MYESDPDGKQLCTKHRTKSAKPDVLSGSPYAVISLSARMATAPSVVMKFDPALAVFEVLSER